MMFDKLRDLIEEGTVKWETHVRLPDRVGFKWTGEDKPDTVFEDPDGYVTSASKDQWLAHVNEHGLAQPEPPAPDTTYDANPQAQQDITSPAEFTQTTAAGDAIPGHNALLGLQSDTAAQPVDEETVKAAQEAATAQGQVGPEEAAPAPAGEPTGPQPDPTVAPSSEQTIPEPATPDTASVSTDAGGSTTSDATPSSGSPDPSVPASPSERADLAADQPSTGQASDTSTASDTNTSS